MANTTVAATNLYGFITDTEFRAFITAFGNALDAVGLVQTADTGQLNRATIVRAGNGVDAGYEVWRFDDALQATRPVFLKVSYGRGISGVYYGRVRIDVGRGTDGAGNLTGFGQVGHGDGAFAPTLLLDGNGSNPTTLWRLSSDGSGLVISLPGANHADSKVLWCIDRFRDDTGAATDKGLAVVNKTGSANFSLLVWDAVRNRCGQQTAGPATVPTSWTAGNAWLLPSGDAAAFPCYVSVPEQFTLKMLLGYNTADIAADTTVAASHLGASRTWLAHGTQITAADLMTQAFVGALQWWAD